MKILHIIFSFTPDGAETMLVDIINCQSATEQVELIIINNHYSSDLIRTIHSKVKVTCLNRRPGSRNPAKLILLNLKISRFSPDIIHYHSHNAVGLTKYKGKSKTFLTVHGMHRPLTYLRKYDQLISISEAVEKDLLARGSFPSLLIYNGINCSQIPVREAAFDDAIFSIVQIGRLYHEIKGQDILLNALHMLVFNMGITHVKVDFIGEGPSEKHLRDLTGKLNLAEYVSFTGFRDRTHIYQTIKEYSLLVQPSIHEGFGLTIAEGMAAEIPVLVSDIPGPVEVIGNGKYGYSFKSQNAASCAEAIRDIVNVKQESFFKNKLDDARDFVVNNYSVEKTAQNYLQAYRAARKK